MARSGSTAAISESSARVLFARVGSMTFYAGPQPGDERPIGGGGHNEKNIGHELFNFAKFDGHLYGWFRAKKGRVNLARVDPNVAAAEKLDEVLVILIAQQHIIGWYRKATLYASTRTTLPAFVKKEILRRLKQSGTKGFKVGGYRFEGNVEHATLLPTHERTHRIPGHVKGGFGQSNIRYLYRRNGEKENAPWTKEALKYVQDYDRANLLVSPEAQASSEEVAMVAQEQAQGFQSDAQLRRLIEKHAMNAAQKELVKKGFHSFKDTSATKPYDLTCAKGGKKFFVEVKGTQTAGNAIILTKNEVDHVEANPDDCILVVVHSVKVTGRKVAKGGIPQVTEAWDLRGGQLTAMQFIWKREFTGLVDDGKLCDCSGMMVHPP